MSFKNKVTYGSALIILYYALLTSCSASKDPASSANNSVSVPPSKESQCLYLFWSRSTEDTKKLQALVESGENFYSAAQVVMKPLPSNAIKLEATCVSESELNPLLRRQLKGLYIGQTSNVFDYQGGAAIVMRTTDRFWKRGVELYKLGKYPEAEASLKHHVKLYPSSTAGWQALADSLAAQGKNRQALEALDKALESAPNNSAVWNDRAAILMRLDHGQEAIAAYRRALELNPRNPILMHNLAWSLLKQKQDLDFAQELASNAVRLEPQRANFWDTLGRIQKTQGEYAEAVISLHHAVSLGAKGEGIEQDMAAALQMLPQEQVERLLKEQKPGEITTPSPSSHGYYIVIGSFREPKNAAKEMRRLEQMGYRMWMEWKKVPNKGKWIRVMIGPYKERSTAIKTAVDLKDGKKIISYIILKK